MLAETVKSTLPEPVLARLRSLMRQVRSAQRRIYATTRRPYAAARRLYAERPRVALGEFGGFRLAYRANTSDEAVIRHSFADDIFFPALPGYAPRPGAVILDIGAHIGTFALLAGTKFPHGVVHAVEASRESCDLVRINVGLNGMQNVRVHHLALSDGHGRVRLHHDLDGNWGHSITKRMSRRGEEVPSEGLAGFLEANAAERVDLAKFNCEGAEFPILMASSEAVLRRIERMLVLYHCELVNAPYSLEGLIAKLREAGFTTELLNHDEMRGWIRATRP